MAAGVTAESVLASIIQGHLECSICHTRYQEPKMLDCSHSFCLKCLQELKKSQNPQNNKLACPLCQRETILPEGAVAKLNINYVLVSLVGETIKQEQLLKGEGSKAICQACDEEDAAMSRCMDCELYLCHKCETVHQRFAALTTHNIKTLDELQARDTTSCKAAKETSDCKMHPNQKLRFYCNACEQLICNQCTDLDHSGSMHSFVNLDTAFTTCLQGARERISQVYKSKTSATIFKSCNSVRKRLSTNLVETNRRISRIAEKKLVQIRHEEKQLKLNALATYKRKDKKFAEMAFAEQVMKTVDSGKKEANHLDILKLRQELLHDYKDVVEQTEDMTYDISFIGFKENYDQVYLGEHLDKEKWSLMTESSTITGDFVAAFSSGDMVIANIDSQKIIKISTNREVLYFKGDSNVKGLAAIAVSKDDQLILLVESAVKVFNKENQLLRQFTPGKEASIESTPTCIAVDDSNLIAVGYKDKEQISLHNPDGSLIRTLPAPMIDKYLTTSNKQLIYTNGTHKKLLCVDYEGNNKFTDTVQAIHQDQHSPHGVCCDPAGDIYTTVSGAKTKSGLKPGTGSAKHATRPCSSIGTSAGGFGTTSGFGTPSGSIGTSQGAIQHYSPNGKIIKSIARVEGNSSGITYTPDGKLVVTGANSTQIFRRV